MIDLHSHILPGLDDGVATLEEARELARAAVADGVVAIAATPHVRADYPTTAERMERLVAELRTDFEAAGIALDVLPGGELDLEQLRQTPPEELARFTLGAGNWLLLEFPYRGWPLALETICYEVRLAGLAPILAHPERNRAVQSRPESLATVVAAGALVQVTAASLDGRFGLAPQAAARRLIELELAHLIASDAHHPSVREVGMTAAAAAVKDEQLAQWLTVEVPGAIAAGRPLPERPHAPARGLRRLLRR